MNFKERKKYKIIAIEFYEKEVLKKKIFSTLKINQKRGKKLKLFIEILYKNIIIKEKRNFLSKIKNKNLKMKHFKSKFDRFQIYFFF